MQSEDDGEAAEKEDQDSQGNQTVDWNNAVVSECGPGAYGAEPDEDADVEKHVDGGLEGVIFCFEAEPVAIKLLDNTLRCMFEGYTYSQVKVFPAMKQASTSSLPIMPTVPTMKS